MLDAKELRANFNEIKRKLARRGKDINIDGFLELDKKRRELIQKSEEMKKEQNAMSKRAPILKKEGKDISGVLKEMKSLSDAIKGIEPLVREANEDIERFLLNIPNAPNDATPDGVGDADNVEVRRWGEPRTFDFAPEPHWDMGKRLGIIDAETAGKTTGARFTFYKGLGARLERAITNFMLDSHVDKNGYTEVFSPILAHRRSMIGTGQLPKFEQDMFKVENTEYFLVPTAEVPITNMYREEILDGARLTIKHCGYTPCFRAEAGAAGRDTRGLIRQHQFNKVELVKFARPETSYDELETLTADAEGILKALGLPYRVVRLCAGDLGFGSAMTYDIEVWMPSYNRYVEISSCSNYEDFQARRANIRFKDDVSDKARFVHTLNGSGLAVGRATAAILENFQNAEGGADVPEALLTYMNGASKIQ
ncbi:MAG: serine--tRNA ligase [Clostridiales bacterium]|jgi:seryl-tRNA synthetase|nr:serine--tRNA ligase [Clostridiales bacterium]